MPFLSQGLRIEEALNTVICLYAFLSQGLRIEVLNTVICLCEANTANLYWWLWPFTNYQPPQVSLDLNLVRKLYFL